MNDSLIRSAWIAPMDGRVIENGAVLIREGQIAALGSFPSLRADCSTIVDAGDCLLLPGLVNAHTHLELSDCTPGEKPADGLEGWLVRMLTRTRLDQQELERRSAEGTRHGLEQCVRFGVTAVGDISRQCHITRPILREGPIRVVSFGEVMAMARRRGLLAERLELASDRSHESEWLETGISPHSPYSIEIDGFRQCLDVAKREGLPLATHLAETKAEWAFLAEHRGPLKALWDAWLTWDDQVPKYPHGPIRMAQEIGLLDYPSVLAHVNYCDDDELSLLAASRASVVYCPRTHDYFGHPPHRFREMLAAGVNVSVGTDSCASSPDLNLVEDLRFIHGRYPEIPAETLWRMVTVNGAKALGKQGVWGQIRQGAAADLVAFPATGRDVLMDVLESAVRPSGVWIGGRRAR